ncbi:MAG: acyl carrier protein [Vicinamibacteria bacterium]
MERGDIFENVQRVFSEHLSIRSLTEESHLIRDLSLDSLQQLTLVVELENRFRISFEEEDEIGIETVGDIVDLLARRLAPRVR